MAQGNGGFGWRQVSWGTVLVCEPLLALAPHLFTTRDVDAVGPEGPDRDAAAFHRALAAALGDPQARVWQATQVHGTDVVDVGDRVADDAARGDILVTRDLHHVVVVRMADCVPILLADRESRVVAAVHAGWRGTRAGVAAAAVRTLSERYGSQPADLVCAIGPSIGPCCYQVGPEVRDAFLSNGLAPGEPRAAGPSWDSIGSSVRGSVGSGFSGVRREQVACWFSPDGDRWRLDLWTANRDQLTAAGVPAEQVHVACHCTATMLDRYFSYRIEGAKAGRLVAAIRGKSL